MIFYDTEWRGETLYLLNQNHDTIGHILKRNGRWVMALGRPKYRKTPYFVCSGPENGPAELMEQYRKMGFQCPPIKA